MSKGKYVFNQKTMRYEKVQLGLSDLIKRIVLSLALLLVAAAALNYTYQQYFPTAKEIALEKELEEVKANYFKITSEVDQLSTVLENIKERDEGVYGMILGVEPIDESVWAMGTGGHKSALLKYNSSSELIESTKSSIDKIQRAPVILSVDRIDVVKERFSSV